MVEQDLSEYAARRVADDDGRAVELSDDVLEHVDDLANFEFLEFTTAGLPAVIDVSDHFNLSGEGSAPDVKVALHGVFALDANLRPVAGDGGTVRGADITCDPI